jgi:hypothetical protein
VGLSFLFLHRELLVEKEKCTPQNIEFIFHDGEGPNAGGIFSKELGINTIPIYLDNWREIEPADDSWQWDTIFPDNTHEYGHCIARIGLLHMLAWNPSYIPYWVNTSDLDTELKNEYGEFVQYSLQQIKQRNIGVDLYLVELEANYAGHEIKNMSLTNDWIIQWIKWETALIKSIDQGAIIVIPLTPTEFRPDETLDNTNDTGKILLGDFVERMIQENVQFDAFGFNIASGLYDKVDEWRTVENVLKNWAAIDKEIFVWAMGYPADNSSIHSFNYPRDGGYSEEWQKEQYVNSLELFLNNTKVIGVSIDLYDYQEPGETNLIPWGLIGGERTQPETLDKRQSFDAVKQSWNAYCRFH